jgi:hypothetical protein
MSVLGYRYEKAAGVAPVLKSCPRHGTADLGGRSPKLPRLCQIVSYANYFCWSRPDDFRQLPPNGFLFRWLACHRAPQVGVLALRVDVIASSVLGLRVQMVRAIAVVADAASDFPPRVPVPP